MSYVAITSSLIESIRHSVRQLKGYEEKDLGSEPPVDPFTGQEEWLRKKWGVLASTEFYLHDELIVRQLIHITVRVSDAWPEGTNVGVSNAYTALINAYPKHRLVNSDGSGVNGYSRPEITCLRADSAQLAAVMDWRVAKKVFDTRWLKVENDIVSFVKGAKSLNEAIKLWPDVRRYIHESYLERVDEKKEKAPKVESAAVQRLKEIDIDNITASSVLARMSQGEGGSDV